MQFQTAQFRAAPSTVAAEHARVRRSTVVADSGQSGWVITPRGQSVELLFLIASWNNVELAGELHIGDIIIEQSHEGHIEIPCYSQPLDLTTTGLQSACNSVGGTYAITAIFRT